MIITFYFFLENIKRYYYVCADYLKGSPAERDCNLENIEPLLGLGEREAMARNTKGVPRESTCRLV